MYANKENLRDIEAYLDQIDSWGGTAPSSVDRFVFFS